MLPVHTKQTRYAIALIVASPTPRPCNRPICPNRVPATLPGMNALLALIASAIWGCHGLRRRHPFAPASIRSPLRAWDRSSLLPVLAAVVFVLGAEHNPSGWLIWGVVGGLAQPIALAFFFEALATGKMGVIAPIGSTAVIVPVAIGLAQGERPAALQLAGIALCVVGVVMASGPELRAVREHDAPGGGRALMLASIAACRFRHRAVLARPGEPLLGRDDPAHVAVSRCCSLGDRRG